MIADTSAIVAILFNEPDAPALVSVIENAQVLRISAATYLEAAIVLDSNLEIVARRNLDDFLRESDFIIEPVTAEQARIAREAYRDYGKSARHRAKLNFGDCFAYALARVFDEPLLYKGKDFVHTDITPALR